MTSHFDYIATVLLVLQAAINEIGAPPVVGGYLILNQGSDTGNAQLKALSENAATLPINRLWISFFSPNMVYKGDKDLSKTGLAGKYDFDTVKGYIAKLKAGGVEAFLSMGGWDFVSG